MKAYRRYYVNSFKRFFCVRVLSIDRLLMKSAVFSPEQEKVRVLEKDIPSIEMSEVLVEVKEVGIDGTDKEIVQGEAGKLPEEEDEIVFGHEALGEIVEVGAEVDSLEEGDLVVPIVRRPGDCINCQNGEMDMCLNGNYKERGIKERHGFLTEYFKEKPEFLVPVPREIEDIAVLLEPTSVAEKSIRMGYDVQDRMIWEPENALVTGSGTLGLLIASLLRMKELQVSITDIEDDEYKAGIFSRLCLNYFDGRDIALHDIPSEIDDQLDMIVEATGNSSIALHSMSVVGTNGVVVLLSVTGGSKEITICSDCLNNGLVLENKAIVGSVNASKDDFEKGIEDLQKVEEKWPGLLEGLITSRYDITEVEEAVNNMGDSIKTVIEF